MRLTNHRREILDLLGHRLEALSAATVHKHLPHINLVTVYRALDYLADNGLVRKLRLDGEEALYEVQHEPHHHALCTECGKVIHFTTNDIALKKEFRLPGFSITDLEVTLRGRCRSHPTSK
jgi:Fe2+ or Zn2+ uptake regulation protein